jgi:hypothetical protein
MIESPPFLSLIGVHLMGLSSLCMPLHSVTIEFLPFISIACAVFYLLLSFFSHCGFAYSMRVLMHWAPACPVLAL